MEETSIIEEVKQKLDNLASEKDGNINNSESISDKENQGPVNEATNIFSLNLEMKRIKNNLKKKQTFSAAVLEFCDSMKKNLNSSNKKLYYDALNIISFRAGKPGFDVEVAKNAFSIAIDKIDCFSSGYKKNIMDWANAINKTNEMTLTSRDDGRFNTIRISKPSGIRSKRNQMKFLMEFISLMNGLSSYPESSDESSSDDGFFFNPYLGFPFGNASLNEEEAEVKTSYPYIKVLKKLTSDIEVKHDSIVRSSFDLDEETFKRVNNLDAKEKLVFCCFSSNLSEIPSYVNLKINKSKINVEESNMNSERRYSGLNITRYVRPGQNKFTLSATACVCTFKFGIQVIEECTNNSLIENIQKNCVMDYDTCFKRVLNSFKEDNEIEQLSIPISLKDPLILSKIQIPVRGTNCTHLQCFDLNTYLLINEKNPKFKCPVCNKVAPYEEIVIDSYFQKMLDTLESEDLEAEIEPNGSFKKCDIQKKRKLQEENNERKAKKFKVDISLPEKINEEKEEKEENEKKNKNYVDLTDD